MFWDNEKDSDRTQRWKNGFLLKIWAKNETRDAILPRIGLLMLTLIGLAVLVRLFGVFR